MRSLFTLRNSLILFAVALGGALGFETDWGSALTTSSTTVRLVPGKHDNASVLPDFSLSSEAANYAQISERPLLNPTRKPAPTQVVMAAPEVAKPQVRRGLYQLIGITDLGTVKIAQLREVASNRVKSVRQGDQLQEMTVAKVEPTQVTLSFQEETDVLSLMKFTPSGRVVAPPAPSVAQPYAPPPTPQQQAAAPAVGIPVQVDVAAPATAATVNQTLIDRRRARLEASNNGQPAGAPSSGTPRPSSFGPPQR